jgi:hypothetical protein
LSITLRYLITPGHGYLEVPSWHLDRIGFVPTEYSFRDGHVCYLEEDCDMPAFLDTWADKVGTGGEILTEDAPFDRPPGSRFVPAKGKPSTYEQWREARYAS